MSIGKRAAFLNSLFQSNRIPLSVSFGGIAGLFLGFSILSGVEIIYFFTLRALCMVYKEEDKLVEIDRMKKEKPLEEFYLGLKLKTFSEKKTTDKKVHFDPTLLQKKPSKLMIFGGTHKEIPDFVPKMRPAPVIELYFLVFYIRLLLSITYSTQPERQESSIQHRIIVREGSWSVPVLKRFRSFPIYHKPIDYHHITPHSKHTHSYSLR